MSPTADSVPSPLATWRPPGFLRPWSESRVPVTTSVLRDRCQRGVSPQGFPMCRKDNAGMRSADACSVGPRFRRSLDRWRKGASPQEVLTCDKGNAGMRACDTCLNRRQDSCGPILAKAAKYGIPWDVRSDQINGNRFPAIQRCTKFRQCGIAVCQHVSCQGGQSWWARAHFVGSGGRVGSSVDQS